MTELNLEDFTIELRQEYELTENECSCLGEVLGICFPGYFSNRIFYKQLPKMSFLAFYKSQLIGQVGIEHRVISVNKTPYQIFGIIDLCVLPKYRHKGLGHILIKKLDDLAIQQGIKHILAFADNTKLYEKLGYKKLKAYCRFLAVEDLSSHSILEKDMSEIMLIKSFEYVDFTDKKIDLLGYLF